MSVFIYNSMKGGGTAGPLSHFIFCVSLCSQCMKRHDVCWIKKIAISSLCAVIIKSFLQIIIKKPFGIECIFM